MKGGNMFFYTGIPVVLSGVAVLMDFRKAAVDNGWILFSVIIGLFLRLIQYGITGMGGFFAGIFLPMILLYPLFIFRMLGAGDIKLLCAIGGIMGPRAAGECVLYAFVIGAGISLAILISTGNICHRLHYLYQYISDLYRTGNLKPYYRKGMSVPENFHFTVPVFLSVLLYAGGVY